MKIQVWDNPPKEPVFSSEDLRRIADAGLYRSVGLNHIAIVIGTCNTVNRTVIVFNASNGVHSGYCLSECDRNTFWRPYSGSITLSS